MTLQQHVKAIINSCYDQYEEMKELDADIMNNEEAKKFIKDHIEFIVSTNGGEEWLYNVEKEALKALKAIKRLEEIRKAIKNENISYGEIAELQSLVKYIGPGDVQLLEWAGVKEK